jgi:hypothetical protein
MLVEPLEKYAHINFLRGYSEMPIYPYAQDTMRQPANPPTLCTCKYVDEALVLLADCPPPLWAFIPLVNLHGRGLSPKTLVGGRGLGHPQSALTTISTFA